MADPIRSLFRALLSRNVSTRASTEKGSTVDDEDVLKPDWDEDPLSPHITSLRGLDRVHSAHTSWSSAMVRSNITTVANVILSVAVLGMAYLHWNSKPTIIIKPPVLTGDIRIEDGLPNKEWQESWALFAAHLLGNINPRNVEFVTRQVNAILSPDLQVSKERDIRRMVEMMRLSNLTQSFEVQDLRYNSKTRMVWVWGYKNTQLVTARTGSDSNSSSSSDNSGSNDRRRWTFEFIIRLNEMGMPVITHIDQYEGLPKFERANGVTDEGQVLSPPEKKNKPKAQKASSESKELAQ